MPKALKGNAGRRPPEPLRDYSDIDDWFGRALGWVIELGLYDVSVDVVF
jgi:hypothetical protein